MHSQAEKWRTDIWNLSEDDSSADVRRTKCTRVRKEQEQTAIAGPDTSWSKEGEEEEEGWACSAAVTVSLHWYVRRGLEYKEMMHFCTLLYAATAAQSATDRDNQYPRSPDIRRCTNITSPQYATVHSTRQRCGDDVGNDGHCDNGAGNSRKTFSYVAATLLGNQRRPTAKNSAHDAWRTSEQLHLQLHYTTTYTYCIQVHT